MVACCFNDEIHIRYQFCKIAYSPLVEWLFVISTMKHTSAIILLDHLPPTPCGLRRYAEQERAQPLRQRNADGHPRASAMPVCARMCVCVCDNYMCLKKNNSWAAKLGFKSTKSGTGEQFLLKNCKAKAHTKGVVLCTHSCHYAHRGV